MVRKLSEDPQTLHRNFLTSLTIFRFLLLGLLHLQAKLFKELFKHFSSINIDKCIMTYDAGAPIFIDFKEYKLSVMYFWVLIGIHFIVIDLLL